MEIRRFMKAFNVVPEVAWYNVWVRMFNLNHRTLAWSCVEHGVLEVVQATALSSCSVAVILGMPGYRNVILYREIIRGEEDGVSDLA